MPEYSKGMLRALENTVFAYEKAIVFLEEGGGEAEVACNWMGYGEHASCHLCVTADADAEYFQKCPACVLDGAWVGDEGMPCITESYFKLRGILYALSLGCPPCGLLKALKARLEWILKRVDENGYTLE